jgi:hypothetical protein
MKKIETIIPSKVINNAKHQVLLKYKQIFLGIDLNQISVSPILMSRSELMKIIELIYEHQLEKILKAKSRHAIFLSEATYEYMESLFDSSKTFLIQNLANLAYTAEKYSKYPEVMFYLQFIMAPRENLNLLFYLYLRQHYKIITGTNFIKHHKTKVDPTQLKSTNKISQLVLEQAFYYDSLTKRKILQHFKSKFQGKGDISYYRFLCEICSLDLQYKDLKLMENLIAVYSIKDKGHLLQVRFSEFASKYSDYVDYVDKNPHLTELQKSSAQKKKKEDVQINQNDDVQGVVNEELNDEEYNIERIKKAPKRISTFQVKSKPQEMAGNPLDRKDFYELDPKDIYETMLKKKNVRLSKKDKGIQSIVLEELENHTNKIMASFIKRNEVVMDNLAEVINYGKTKIHRKLLFICVAIFINDRELFFNLLRKKLGKDEETLKFWNDLNIAYDQLKDTGKVDRSVAKVFLQTLFEDKILSNQVIFFLNFLFRTDFDIVNYHVDFEFTKDELVIQQY